MISHELDNESENNKKNPAHEEGKGKEEVTGRDFEEWRARFVDEEPLSSDDIELFFPDDNPKQEEKAAGTTSYEPGSGKSLSGNAVARLAQASLLAGAIGDSLGADIEFDSLAQIRDRFPEGVDRLARCHAPSNWFTDDTQMTLFTAEGLVRAQVAATLGTGADRMSVIHHALLRWLHTQGCRPLIPIDTGTGLVCDSRLRYRAAPGNTCLRSLRSTTRLGQPANNDSKGCGTIMRVAPVALAIDRAEVRQVAIGSSALTHGHPLGQLAAAVWAELIAEVLAGREVEAAAEDLSATYREEVEHGREIARHMDAALAAPRDGAPETVESLGAGWVAEEALAIALYSVIAAEGNLERGLRIAVTHSGDCDSTATIAGHLLGALYPEQSFSHPLARRIKGRDIIFRLGAGLCQARHWNSAEAVAQSTRYPPR